MEGLHCLKYLLEENDFLCKIDLKDVYFSGPLCLSSRKDIFGLGLAPRIFSKLLKVPIALLRRLNIRLVIYLDGILLMGKTLEEILMSRDKLIFLFQHLGFVINLKKSVLKPSQQIEFLGPKNRYPQHDFGTNRGKDGKVNFEMSESPFSPSKSNHCFGINKIDGQEMSEK